MPSCMPMYQLPSMFPDDADVKAVAEAMFDRFEYFMFHKADGLLRTDLKKPLGKVSYHIPCRLRVENLGQKTREMLQLVPNTTVNTVEPYSLLPFAYGH
jgi:glycerol-3-phosphate dehydrogenase subunit C